MSAADLAAYQAALAGAAGLLLFAVAAIALLVMLLMRAQAGQSDGELRRAARRLEDMAEVGADWLWETNAQHQFTYVSQRFDEVTGHSGADLIGTTRWDFAGADLEDQAWRQHLNDLAARRAFSDFVYQSRDADGRSRWIATAGKPVFDHAGAFLGYRGTSADVTAEVEAREAAHAAEKRARAVVDGTLDAFVSVDTGGHVVDWNGQAERLFGWSREEAVGRHLYELIVPERHQPAHGAAVLAGGDGEESRTEPAQPRRMEIEACCRDGSEIPVELTVTAAPGPDGQRYAAFIRDIRETRAAARALREAKEQAELANRTKSEFLAAMSHELRTPLNAIIGFSELMANEVRGELPDEYRGYAADIQDSGRHLLSVINDILDISKIEAGRIELKEERVDLAELVETSLRLVRERARNSDITLGNDVPAGLPPVVADAQRVKQVLLNLLGNAVKFTPKGTVRVEAFVEDDGLRLTVRDDGVGMDPADLPRALTPFHQLDSGLGRRHEGTGLGLPLCQRMVELHGGRLEIDTAPGRGTAASVVFPIERLETTKRSAVAGCAAAR